MFLITVKQQIPGQPNLAHSIKRNFGAITLKELADWCHTFIRACASAGWQRKRADSDDAFATKFMHVAFHRPEFRATGLEGFMVLERAGTATCITIEIESLEPKTAFEAAKLFTR